MPPRSRAQRQQNEEAEGGNENEAARGRAARGGRSGWIRASELPANYQGGQPAQQAQVEPQAARLRIAFWPWDIQYPVEYDFNMDQALMEVRGLPSGHLFNDFELEEYITERLADYEYARAEMPAEHPLFHMENELRTLYRFYPDIDWLQMPALPRICSKSKCHVEGQVVRAPFKHQGQICTFARHNLRSMRCDLCTGDQTAAHKLGKQRENQVRRLKIQLSHEQDVARREDLMNQMATLLLTLNQVTVRSSWWSNQFFGAETDRDDYLRRLSQPYLDANNNLDFQVIFSEMDAIIREFLAASPQERNQLHQNDASLVPVAKVKKIFNPINTPIRIKRGKEIYSVNDFLNWQEVQSFFKAFRSRCVVSGLNGRDFTLSLDRKIDSTGRYNWTDINPMLWSINAAKSSFRFAFETDANLQMWFDEHHEEYDDLVNQTLDAYVMNGHAVNEEDIDRADNEIAQTWVVVVEMRKYFCALLEHYHSHGNAQFYHDFIQQ